ncbi:LysE family transporter, partial [Actinoplanes sp. NPDC048791]|uniref:LysE family transporter n=1 Tax=Actinoplanes sp. NPDC048791 TaxID=3154623 RepID=UPI00340FEE1E
LGAATADGVYALIAVLGGAALAAAIAPIATPLRWVAAVILLLLAVHTAWSALRKRTTQPDSSDDPARPERASPDGGARAPGLADPDAGALGAGPVAAVPVAGRDGGISDAGRDGGVSDAGRDGGVSDAGRDGPAAAADGLAAPRSAGKGAGGLDTTTAGRAYLGVLGLTLLNPATIVYFAALVMGRGGTGGGVWFVVGAFVASASWQLLIAGGGALVGRLLTGDRGRLITAMVSSAVIAVLAVGLVT